MVDQIKQFSLVQIITWVVLFFVGVSSWLAKESFADMKLTIVRIEQNLSRLDDRVDTHLELHPDKALAAEIARLKTLHEINGN